MHITMTPNITMYLIIGIIVVGLYLYYLWWYSFITILLDSSCLLTNDDQFFDRLNAVNLYARNVSSIQSYKKRIQTITVKPSFVDKLRMAKCINNINRKIKKVNSSWVNKNKFYSLKWTIIVFDGDYEARMPHTRLNVIALPKHILKSNKLEEILLHEQLHVYQKTFPNETEQYVNKRYTPVTTVSNLSRANPDTNIYIYKDKNNKILSCEFNSNQPENLNDVNYTHMGTPRYEHPYEMLVYEFIDLYVQIA